MPCTGEPWYMINWPSISYRKSLDMLKYHEDVCANMVSEKLKSMTLNAQAWMIPYLGMHQHEQSITPASKFFVKGTNLFNLLIKKALHQSISSPPFPRNMLSPFPFYEHRIHTPTYITYKWMLSPTILLPQPFFLYISLIAYIANPQSYVRIIESKVFFNDLIRRSWCIYWPLAIF